MLSICNCNEIWLLNMTARFQTRPAWDTREESMDRSKLFALQMDETVPIRITSVLEHTFRKLCCIHTLILLMPAESIEIESCWAWWIDKFVYYHDWSEILVLEAACRCKIKESSDVSLMGDNQLSPGVTEWACQGFKPIQCSWILFWPQNWKSACLVCHSQNISPRKDQCRHNSSYNRAKKMPFQCISYSGKNASDTIFCVT